MFSLHFNLFFTPLFSKIGFSYITKTDEIQNNAADTNKSKPNEWTIFIYMEARNNLAPFASKNIEAIANNKTSDQIKFLVQLDQPNKPGAWRYRVEHQKVLLDDYQDVPNPQNVVDKIVDFVKWGAKAHPAEKYCLVFWNHGVGVLNPPYGDPMRVMLSQAHNDVCLDPSKVIFLETQDLCPEDEALSSEIAYKRGLMFDEENQIYLTTQDLGRALETITSEVIKKKLEIVAFDACYMANLEIDAEICDYANYRVASEELELAHGWPYDQITQALCNRNHTPDQFAKMVVTNFGNNYRGKTNIFTQSAIRLDATRQLTLELNNILDYIELLAQEDKAFVLDTIRQARKNCQQFTAKVYIDLASFYYCLHELIEQKLYSLEQLNLQSIRLRRPAPNNQRLQQAANALKQQLQKALSSISNAVLENSCSSFLSKAKGISIYFPQKQVDASYQCCKFAKNSRWLNFISAFTMR